MFADRHHLLFDRVSWSARSESKALRDDPTLIVKMERSEHNELHRHCVAVPVLGYYALTRTLATYEPGDTSLRSLENLMQSVGEAITHPKTHQIERELGNLTIWALDLQRPFIAETQYERRLPRTIQSY